MSSSALLSFCGPGARTKISELRSSLHGSIFLNCAGVFDGRLLALGADLDAEVDLVSFDRTREWRFSKLALVLARKFFAVLFESESRSTGPGWSFNRKGPGAGDISFISGSRSRR